MAKTEAIEVSGAGEALPTAKRSPARALASLRSGLLGVKPVSAKRRAVALAIAFAADLLQLVLWPAFAEGAASPFDDALDVAVGAALWATLGMSPRLAFAFAMELVPGADLFPTWTAVVMSIPLEPRIAGRSSDLDAPVATPL